MKQEDKNSCGEKESTYTNNVMCVIIVSVFMCIPSYENFPYYGKQV